MIRAIMRLGDRFGLWRFGTKTGDAVQLTLIVARVETMTGQPCEFNLLSALVHPMGHDDVVRALDVGLKLGLLRRHRERPLYVADAEKLERYCPRAYKAVLEWV